MYEKKEGICIETIKNICTQLQATNSKKEKESILRYNENVRGFKEILYFLLNPYIITGISTKKINKDIGKIPNINYSELLDIGSARDTYYGMSNLMNYLKVNNTGRDIDVSVCEYYFTNFDAEMQSFIKSIITKTLRLGCDSKTVNKVYGKDFIPEYEVQQAYSIEKYPLKQNEWFSLSEKQNGIRGSFVDGKILSRQGQEIIGLNHIVEDIYSLGLENYFIDGELKRKNVDNISDNENFRIGTGILNSDATEKPEIYFTVFDVFPAIEFKNGQSNDTYKKRKETLYALKEKIRSNNTANLDVVEIYYEGSDQSEIEKWLDVAVDQDKEGLMLNKDTVYKCKRHNGILKVKRFYTVDLEIVKIEEGSGRLQGTLGAIVVDYKGNEVNVGSGFTDGQRSEMWSYKDELIGRIIEVKYKEESQDKKTGLYSLQFPIFVMLREDGKQVSYN